MNIKTVLMAAIVLFTSNAGATLVSGTSLQGVLDGITAGGSSSINVNDDQYQPDETWSRTASGAVASRLIVELAGYANSNSFGIYDVADTNQTVQLFSGTESAGSAATLLEFSGLLVAVTFDASGNMTGSDSASFSSSLFGFYLDTPDGTWYSEQDENSDGADHMVALRGNNSDYIQPLGTSSPALWTENEFIYAWEDKSGLGDSDYNDFVVMVESVIGVPEPSTLALFSIVILGLGMVAGRKTMARS